MTRELPATIAEYLQHLRRALEGADPAMIQDALCDAEEYLHAELAAHPERSEAEVIAEVAGTYGAPVEVADIYRKTEATVQSALQAQAPLVAQARQRQEARDGGGGQAHGQDSVRRQVFGVFTDPRSYGALFYMLLALASGIFFFTWTVTGFSLGIGLAILIIGLPFIVLFVGASRVLALVEGRLIETLLGERMPRRSPYVDHDQPLLRRIAGMFADPRTWGTFFYFVLMLPLGIVYFSVAVTGLSVSLGLLFGPILRLFGVPVMIDLGGSRDLIGQHPLATPLVMLAGFLALTLTMHLARVVGKAHGALAKQLLVRTRALAPAA
ncbi:sensor domain-containing protein [Luteimonas sp. e5]